MRAFITGASGFIGGHLVEHLLKKNWQVRALVHKKKILRQEKIEIVRGDISNLGLLRNALQEVDVLFHLASALGSSLISKKEFHAINAQGTQNVLEAASQANVRRIVHFSSAGVLGSVKKNEVADENYPLNPQNIYDKTKLEGEKIALRFAQRGMDVCIVRPGWAYGPHDRRTFKLINAIDKKRFIFVSKGQTCQTPVFIEDLIQATLLGAEKGRRGEIYHLAGKEVLTVREIVETIAWITGKKIPPFTLPVFPVRCAAWIMEKLFSLIRKEAPLNPSRLSFFIHPKPLSIEKAVKELGYSPQTDFKKGMALSILWYRENGWL